jgi:hypothetical protein
MSEQVFRGGSGPGNVAELWLRGAGVLFDLQTETMRNLLRVQSQSAASYGAPDFSSFFGEVDDRAKRIFSTGADQMGKLFRRWNQIAEAQCELGRTLMSQTGVVVDNMRSGIEDVDRKAQEELEQVRRFIEDARASLQKLPQIQRAYSFESPAAGTATRTEQDRQKSSSKA